MSHLPAISLIEAENDERETKTLIAAEEAALALLCLQQRIIELEREVRFLNGCIPTSAVVTPQRINRI